MKQIYVKIEYYPQLKNTDKAFRVLRRQKKNLSNLFELDSYFWKDIGSFKTLTEAEEWAVSRDNQVIYKGVKRYGS